MATVAQINSLNASIQALQTSLTSLEGSTLTQSDANAFYLMVCGVFVFFMQAGFALLEAGSVRSKNTKNILMKNLLDACIGALVWWGWGYGIAYDGGGSSGPDGNGFIGHGDGNQLGSFFTGSYDSTSASSGGDYAGWWFQYVFCAAAATIVSGAMAERTTLIGYLVYTMLLSGFVYPVVVYWTWGYGWASSWNEGLLDFAGSGIVHMTGGIAALVGAAVVGPRKGRFDESSKPIPMPASNTTFQVLGTFILWVGWYGFNPGSTLGLAGSAGTMSRAVCTTTLAAATGGCTVVVIDKFLISHTWDVSMLCNGILAGLVSITAGCAAVYPWAAIIIGFLGGFAYLAGSKTTLYICKVDDPLDAFAVHGCCGFWGVIAAALLAAPEFGATGAFYGDGAKLVAGFVFCLANIAWTGGFMLITFIILKATGLLRVSAEMEEAGMDVSKHGGSAFN
ncbi:hypothetical protein AB1Y20_005113 [Prymnesium parvum]|uniref:Ammonium transporter n=1 Tax=Prymnesium parvum TaxID=97485 RepID=A0AB34J2F3_PRYPA